MLRVDSETRWVREMLTQNPRILIQLFQRLRHRIDTRTPSHAKALISLANRETGQVCDALEVLYHHREPDLHRCTVQSAHQQTRMPKDRYLIDSAKVAVRGI
jgi:hypothetical protein